MSRFVEIQSKVLSLGPGEYQRLCSAYIKKKYRLDNMHDIGSKEGTNKTTIGIPDSYSIDENLKYILCMYGTVEKKSVEKLEQDIQDACNSTKTGITQEQIKEVVCFHTNTNIKPGDYNRLINLIPNIKITLIDIDTLAHDIDENYQSIASDYLSILIDTNQISDIDTFIERYDKSSINSPLKIDFVYRKDIDLIYKSINDSKMTIISGKPGNGKTKIAIEVLKELEQKEQYNPLCVRINGLELYDDMKTLLENDKKYIIFIDDINNLNGIQSIIDLIITNKNENIKILATTRDYLLDDVMRKIKVCIEPSVFVLKKMEDSEIIDILENTYNVKNKEWQQKILKISNGNPRLAIMSFISVRDGKIDSLNSVYDVFKNYYEDIFNQKKLSQYEIKILFYISLLSPISTSNEIVKKILNDLQIYDINVFKKLRDIELIDYFNEDALKVCDQNFANYLVYKYLIVDKIIKISDLLKQIYPNFISKFINTVNMVNEQFYSEEALNYMTDEINEVWENEPYNSDWNFVNYFHNINVPKSLCKIKEKIDIYSNEGFPEEIKYNSNVYMRDDLISLLSDFKNTEYLKISFELLLLYLDKRPVLYNEICKGIKDYWLMKNPNTDFSLEIEIMNILYSKYKTSDKVEMKGIYKIILEHTLLYCLELQFRYSEQGKNSRTINLVTFELQGNENVFEFRKKIFDIVFQLCDEEEKNYNLLLNNYIWFYNEEQKEIFKSDISFLDEYIFSNWKNISIMQSKLLYQLKEKCKKFGIEPPNSLEKYNECSEFLIINMFEKCNYNRKNEELISYLRNRDKDDYNTMFLVIKKVDEYSINIDRWKIQCSLNLLFEYVLENDKESFNDIFKLYLGAECPFVEGIYCIRGITDKNIIEKMLEDIINSTIYLKYYLLSCILNNYFNEKYIPIVINFIKSQKENENKYTLSIESVYEYSKFNKAILENYIKDILIENNLGLYSSFTNSFIDKTFVETIYNTFENKEIIEELYLKTVNCHSDYEGNLGYLLSINNYDFLSKILEVESSDHAGKIKNIVKNIWNYIDYKKIISYSYNKIMESYLGYLRVHKLFDFDDDENIRDKQLEWFKDKILEIKDDKEKIYYLFYIICEKEKNFKRELILFLLDNTNNIDIFKNVCFFSHSESWSGSRVPIIERKIEFIQSILDDIISKDDLSYIYHIDYLNERIKDYQEQIKETQIKEYVDDFLN